MVGGNPGTPQPGLDGGGYPIPGLEGGGYPIPGLDGGGVPQVWMGGGSTLGTPPPIRQNSIASTCYPAVGMPLAFTQEDFLVFL